MGLLITTNLQTETKKNANKPISDDCIIVYMNFNFRIIWQILCGAKFTPPPGESPERVGPPQKVVFIDNLLYTGKYFHVVNSEMC